ncbi:hypothetical protein NAEGRDRAFT_58769 [Naegleria gruberi]|uniref:Uncharacterized protein n=1 Tax=Naegleria gruberi TaxID=5762 RepID=D2VNP7_NAEGR|nr:uncharacterized protein NAEGRDRAFT_58769 [Naegleria gruberi]EFC41444.1 hypothetical protein NAEGRDRAFT_58769 [Naegleria gruberi]|eukprot:XP_002674188.1 hypothetical protein NAEGRDRAFT_58769 [Naegleria gruberi strain NEG-M]
MFPSSSNNQQQQQTFQDLFIKSINQTQINGSTNNDMFQSTYITIPNVSNSGSSNSTSTSATIQIPSNTTWNFGATDPQQQLTLNESNGLHALSNTTNTNLGNALSNFNNDKVLEQALIMMVNGANNRNRSQSAGSIPTSNSLGVSPTLSNNSPQTFGGSAQGNSLVQMSSSLPNSTCAPSFVQGKSFNPGQLGFTQPFTVRSDYKVSTTENQDSTNAPTNINGLQLIFSELLTNPQHQTNSMFNLGQLGQQQNNFNSANQQNQFILHSQAPTSQQQVNNNQFSPILSSLMISQPSSPIQVTNQIVINSNPMPSVSPTSTSPPTQPLTTMNINPSSITTHVSPTCSPTSTPSSSLTKSTNGGKQRRQRSVSCTSQSSPYPPTTQQQFTFHSPNETQDSPKKGTRRSGIKFAIDFMDNAQQFDIKHTSLTPSTMKQHIAERDERERAGVKKRGRPKGSGIKQQVKRGDLLFYQNCYNSVEGLYKGRADPGRDDDDDEGGFTV